MNYGIDAHAHLFDAFATRAAILPDFPLWVSGLDFGRQEAFVFTVVPLSDLLSNDVIRERVGVVEEDMEGLVCADARRDVDCAKVRWVKDL